MASKTTAAKPAAKKAAPKRTRKPPAPPKTVDAIEVSVGDAHVVLTLDRARFRLEPAAVHQLKRDLESAHIALN